MPGEKTTKKNEALKTLKEPKPKTAELAQPGPPSVKSEGGRKPAKQKKKPPRADQKKRGETKDRREMQM